MRLPTKLGRVAVTVVALAAAGTAPGLAPAPAPRPLDYRDRKPTIDTADKLRVLSANKAAELEKEVRKAYEKLAPSVVRTWTHGPDGRAFDDKGRRVGLGSGSGVIIDKSGLILTCAHHGLSPLTPLTIELADGKRVKGTTLGRFETKDFSPDLGLARIEEKGEWPAAALSAADAPEPGTVCLAISYPGTLAPGRPPLLRQGRTLPAYPDYPWLLATTTYTPGDSGGPLFDLEGRVLGALHGGDYQGPAMYQPIAPLHPFQGRLGAGQIVPAPRDPVRALHSRTAFRGAFAPAPDLEDDVLRAGVYTVRVLDGTTQIALGLVVDPEGRVVTKRTAVLGHSNLLCRLGWQGATDGRPVPARVAAQSAEHDLALLKLDGKLDAAAIKANGFGELRWADKSPLVGQLVAPLLGRFSDPLQFGCVGAAVGTEDRPYADVPQIMLVVEAGPKGEPVYKEGNPALPARVFQHAEPEGFRGLLRNGDVITHLNGIRTPTLEDYRKVQDGLVYAPRPDGKLDTTAAASGSFAGEPVVVGVLRDGKATDVPIYKVHSALQPTLTWDMCPLSIRRDGFPAVFAHDGRVRPEQCGGPVVDLGGRVVGLNIAQADPTRTLAIPADMVQKVVAHLREEAAKKDAPK
jgi:serine protease Do